jgi:muconolactone delta-isomerase
MPPPATSYMFSPGQLVLVWREKGGWKGTSLLSKIHDMNEFVHYTAVDPRQFSVTQIKPLSTKDSAMFAANLNRIMKNHSW